MINQETHEYKLGMINKNKFGTDMKIIKVVSWDKVIVQFQDEHKFEKEVFYQNFRNGTVKNPYDRVILGRGYLGVGKYKAVVNGRITDQYNAWSNIILRCYSDKHRYLFESYPDCEICEEWCDFQVFAKWYDENYYQVEGRLHIDKDVLVKGNKIYSPDTCLLLPQRINMIFTSKPNKWNLPSGISMSKSGKYITSYNGVHLGLKNTLEEAVDTHDAAKRIHIKEVVEEYKTILPDKVRDALLRW